MWLHHLKRQKIGRWFDSWKFFQPFSMVWTQKSICPVKNQYLPLRKTLVFHQQEFFFLTFSTGSRSWKFFRKKDPFWVKNVKTLWDFSHWWVEPPEKRKILPWWWEDFSKIPFAFSALTSSGVCHSFREIARISLSKFFEKRHNFSQPFFLILTP